MSRAEACRKRIEDLYARHRAGEAFEAVRLNITRLFTDEELQAGLWPKDFPYPDGKTRAGEALRIGTGLTTVEVDVWSDGRKLHLAFLGSRRWVD